MNMSELYKGIRNAPGIMSLGLGLVISTVPQPALADILNQDVPQVAQQQEIAVSLETFLNVQYQRTDTMAAISNPISVDEIYHYHIRTKTSWVNGELTFEEESYLESVLAYVKGTDAFGYELHVIGDIKRNPLNPEQPITQYIVFIREGEDVAYYVETTGTFDESHFRNKIRIHLDQQRQKEL